MEPSIRYSELVVELLGIESDFLGKAHPSEPLRGFAGQLPSIRLATDAELTGGRPVGELFPLVRAGLLYYYDSIPETHAIDRGVSHALADYWQAMIFRREGDSENARKAYAQAGELPFFSALHDDISKFSALFARQFNWTPYLFTGQCEQFRFGDFELEKEVVAIQRAEFATVFEYTWRRSVGETE